MRTRDLEYHLPEDLIAITPAQPRDSARLFVVSRSDESVREHVHVRDLPDFLNAHDALVFNATRVAPARLTGKRIDSGGAVEGLFIEELAAVDNQLIWKTLLRSNGKLRSGLKVALHSANSAVAVTLTLIEREEAGWIVAASLVGAEALGQSNTDALLRLVGATPLPPYILRRRRECDAPTSDDLDQQWYQTVFARDEAERSVAAPTAGLHFTPELLSQIDARDVERLEVLLDVGEGTFKPVEAERIEDHTMHMERFHVPAPTVKAFAMRQETKSEGHLFAVGTTSARAIESLPRAIPDQAIHEGFTGETTLLITPGYQWSRVEGLLTNFHLPRSTLLAMVAALFPGGLAQTLDVYEEAIALQYRFFSYGDAMLVMP